MEVGVFLSLRRHGEPQGGKRRRYEECTALPGTWTALLLMKEPGKRKLIASGLVIYSRKQYLLSSPPVDTETGLAGN